MSTVSLFGPNLDDFIEQGPEREGVTEISTGLAIVREESDLVVAPMSAALKRIMLQTTAFFAFTKAQEERIRATDSKATWDAFESEVNELFTPTIQMLATRSFVQMMLDVRAAGKNPPEFVHFAVTTDGYIVGATEHNTSLCKRIAQLTPP